MHIERFGLKWSLKPKGYYQSTTAVAGKRQWLHQYTYERHYGAIPAGQHIHHIDGDKGNNSIDNLECLTAAEHLSKHPQDAARLTALSAQGRAAIKAGVKSRRKLRAAMDRTRACDYCGAVFEPHPHSRDNARFCSDGCRSKGARGNRADSFTEPRPCRQCGAAFTPPPRGFSQALFCSSKCFDKHRYTNKTLARKCVGCGASYSISQGNAPTYCPTCNAARAVQPRIRPCTCCGVSFVSRVEHGNAFCGRPCANKYRRLGADPARLERYQTAVREGRVNPRDRVPADI